MKKTISGISRNHCITRREFLWLASLSTVGLVAGCAANPVTGRQELMLVSEDQEIQIDRQNAPHQFSADYGIVQDRTLNNYISRTGMGMAATTHRPHMPFSFQVVNANYVNAYAFPGGSIACTRGILLSLENEAELAALLGHELGHVNARHTAQQMSKGALTQAVVGGISVIAGTQGSALGQITSQLGMMGAGALLASYSRDNEREADALGMEYMVRAGYSPKGMVGLMDILRSQYRHNPSTLELMFSTHPMSDERYQTAVKRKQATYSAAENLPLYRERYMDNTAKLRSLKGAIAEMQLGEKQILKKNIGAAEGHFQRALRMAPNDYTALVMMSTSQLIQEKNREGMAYAERAQRVYPQEAQAYHLSGIAKLKTGDFEGAYGEFAGYESRLPGNPNTIFFMGYAQEGMQHRDRAAKDYHRYLQVVQQGEMAQHAYARLRQWGYYK